MTLYPRPLLLLLPLLAACGRGPDAPAAGTSAAPSTTGAVVDPSLPDTHLFDMPDSTEVWLVAGRVGRGATGAPCQERGVQLRKGALKIPVPLLYTSTMPEERSGMLFARLSTDCVSGDTYRIDLTTGQPTRVGAR